jgi:HK97 family phage major capsid protein
MGDQSEIKHLLEEQNAAFSEFKTRYDERMKNMESAFTDLAKKANRPGAGSFSSDPGDQEHKNAFLSYLRTGRDTELKRESKGMEIGSDPDGGYLVPKFIDTEISKALAELSPMREICRVVKVESGDFSMLHSAGGTGYAWVGETEERPKTATPRLMEIKPPIGEIYAMPPVTQRLLDDAGFDLEGWLIDELTEVFGAGEGAAFTAGNGINKPRGFLTYDIENTADGTRADTALQYVASGASGAFASTNPSDKLISLVHSLKPRYRKEASWVMNTNTLEQIRAMKNTTGDYIWRAGLEAGQPDTLLGYPVYEDENMPDVSANSLSIAFGNFMRGYTIVDRNSSMLRDPFTAKPHVLFYTTRRVGGAVRDFRAIKLMKFAAS